MFECWRGCPARQQSPDTTAMHAARPAAGWKAFAPGTGVDPVPNRLARPNRCRSSGAHGYRLKRGVSASLPVSQSVHLPRVVSHILTEQ